MNLTRLNLAQAAAHVHLDANELKHFVQRGELVADEHAGDLWFDHRTLDEWAQRQLLAANAKEQDRFHRSTLTEARKAHREDWHLAELLPPGGVTLALAGKTKAGVVRDMAELADKTGLVYDFEGLVKELLAREEVASTAVGEGAAFLHPRYHDPYFFQETFIAYGRAERPVFFGAADGQATRHFFLICSTNDEQHLQILSRLAVMAHATEFLAILDEATTVEEVAEIIRAAEAGVLK